MSDFDTRRIGEIAQLEAQIRQLQVQLRDSQVASSKWEPKVSSELETTNSVGRITLQFGGNNVSVKLAAENLFNGDATSITSQVLDAMCKALVIDKLRPIIQPEVDRLVKNVTALQQRTW